MDQHPVAHAQGVGAVIEQADVHVAPDAGHVDLREAIRLIHHCDDLARDC